MGQSAASVQLPRRSRLIAVVGLFALVAAACGSGVASEQADEVDSSSAQQESESTDSANANTPVAGSSDAEPGTIESYLGTSANVLRNSGGGGGGGAGGAGFDEEAVLEEQRLIQQQIQVCMQAEGFTYVPEEVGDGLRFFLASEDTGVSPESYAETEGFGISTRFDALLDTEVDTTEEVSPNDEHLATLSEGEADAWQFALRGAPPERNAQGQLIDPETGEPLGRGQGPQAGGCSAEAQETVRGDLTELAGLADSFAELEDRIAADPRITEIGRAWVACMGDEGFDFDSEDEARAAIREDFQPLLRSFIQSSNAGNDNNDNNDNNGDNAGGNGAGRGPGNQLQAIASIELTPDQEQDLAALQDRERALAVASHRCHGDTLDELAEIRLRYEAEFVAENQAALEAFGN